jgi:hypothetical protein
MPNLISIGDRAFFRFNGGDFTFRTLDETYLPKLEHIGVEAFAQFVQPAEDRFKISIQLNGMPSLISIGASAFSTFIAPFMLLQIECECSNLEAIGRDVFVTFGYGSGSKIAFTDLARLRSIGSNAFYNFGSRNAANIYELVFTGVSPSLTTIGVGAFG